MSNDIPPPPPPLPETDDVEELGLEMLDSLPPVPPAPEEAGEALDPFGAGALAAAPVPKDADPFGVVAAIRQQAEPHYGRPSGDDTIQTTYIVPARTLVMD